MEQSWVGVQQAMPPLFHRIPLRTRFAGRYLGLSTKVAQHGKIKHWDQQSWLHSLPFPGYRWVMLA